MCGEGEGGGTFLIYKERVRAVMSISAVCQRTLLSYRRILYLTYVAECATLWYGKGTVTIYLR